MAFLDAGGRRHRVVFVVESVRGTHADLGVRGTTFLNEPRNVTGDQWATNSRDQDGHLLSIFGPEHAPSVVP